MQNSRRLACASARRFGSLSCFATIACISVHNKPVAAHAAPSAIAMPPRVNSPTTDQLTKDEYIFLREEMRHEDNLINARLSWLVNSQSFLFGAFAITLNGSTQSKFPMFARLNVILVTWLPVAGILAVTASYLTIWAAILHIRRVRRLARGKYPPHLLPLHGEVSIGRMGLSGAVFIPMIFLAVWLAVILKIYFGN